MSYMLYVRILLTYWSIYWREQLRHMIDEGEESGDPFLLYPKAINDLESIYLYSSSEFGIQRTEDYFWRLKQVFSVCG